MPEKTLFVAQPRTLIGKKSNQLRRQKLIPANINGDVDQPIPVAVDRVAFTKLYAKVGDTGLVYIKVEGENKERPVLVSELQRDPLSDEVVHVVLRQVNLSEKVEAEVPVETIGELQVKNALVVKVHDAIDVEALPGDFPDKFEIDISQFTQFGQMVTFNQLSYDKSKVKLMIEDEELDTPVVLVQEIKEQVEEAPVAPVEGAAAEAAPAEGGSAAPAAEGAKEEPKKE
jgi:large subunit ribosomal protein L25